MASYFENTKEYLMTKEDEEDYRNNNFYRFCEKSVESYKVRDHFHITSEYKGPAHNTCNKTVTQKRNYLIPFIFHNFSNYDCHLFFKKLVEKKNNKVKIDFIPRTKEEYSSVTYCCIRVIDSCRFFVK